MIKGETIVPVRSLPGVKRDGTEFEGGWYVDAQWCRFRRGLPRKIGGYRSITQNLQGPVYGTLVHSDNGVNRVYTGSSNALEYTDITEDGIGGGVGNRTPTTGYTPSNYNLWQFAEVYDGGGAASVLLAHAAPNLLTMDSTGTSPLFYGDISASAVLTDTGAPNTCGGVFSAPPYAFLMCKDGLILWCAPNTPTNWSTGGAGNARITKSKLIYGAQVRGVDTLTFLVWSLDTLIRGTFVGGTALFDFNTIGTISLMSSRSIVEYNGVYYWMAQDRFQVYNGVIQDLPNTFNLDWVLDNINMNQRQKVWGHAVPKYGEIWWHIPTGDSVDCDMVVIYNTVEKTWYDSRVARTSGYNYSFFRWPVLVDLAVSSTTRVRVLGGVAASSAGTAANAFDGDPATVCNAGVNGTIDYDWGQNVRKRIRRLGIRPAAGMTSPCSIEFLYSNDTGTSITNWTSLYVVPSQTWTTSTDYYFTLPDDLTPDEVRGIRVRTTGGDTLNVEEVYYDQYGHILLQHEFGYDRIIGSTPEAIDSYFETADISWMSTGPVGGSESWVGKDVQMEAVTLEPDFQQTGDMSVSITGRAYPHSPLETLATKPFDTDTLKVDFKTQKRILRFKFRSNTQGGFYQMGQPVIKIGEGDVHK